jgi:predicted metalloprotease with PDZ domain
MVELAPGSEPQLHLDLRQPERHLVQARLELVPRHRRLELRLPAWTPGSYLIRDYVRTLEALEVRQGGRSWAVERREVACWTLDLDALDPVTIHWRILATELSVRTCHLNSDHGFLALAGVALLVEGERWNRHHLNLQLPQGWQAFVPLPADPSGGWWAEDFDQLVDTPVEVGPHPQHCFAVAGVPHRWVGWGGDLPSRDPSWLGAVEQVCLACCRLMGASTPPAAHYLFVLHLLEQGYGGLEHDHSCVLQYGRQALARPDGRRKLLQLVAHEYLHQWNVRRLRPAQLTPIPYHQPAIVPTLWFAEGITSYLDLLLPRAAGLTTEEEVLEDLGADLSRYLLTPGRHGQSLRQSSQEAWVKLYRQDAYSADSQVSYYLKGAVVALMLDLHLRRHGSWLGAVLQELWSRFGASRRGYGEMDLLAAFCSHAEDLSTILPKWLESTDDPTIDSYLADVGLRLLPNYFTHWSFGWQVDSDRGGLRLKRVERDGPAEQAGLEVGDELIAIAGARLRQPEDLHSLGTAQLQSQPQLQPIEPMELLMCRDGRIRSLTIQPAPPQIQTWRLAPLPEAAPASGERRQRWLGLRP